MVKENKGFFSIDALFAVALLMVVLTSFLNLYEGRRASAELAGVRLEAKMVGERFAAAINTVYTNGPNFELYLEMPENIGGYLYQITFDNGLRQIYIVSPIWGTVGGWIVCNNVENFTLGPENLGIRIRLHWVGNQIRVST